MVSSLMTSSLCYYHQDENNDIKQINVKNRNSKDRNRTNSSYSRSNTRTTSSPSFTANIRTKSGMTTFSSFTNTSSNSWISRISRIKRWSNDISNSWIRNVKIHRIKINRKNLSKIKNIRKDKRISNDIKIKKVSSNFSLTASSSCISIRSNANSSGSCRRRCNFNSFFSKNSSFHLMLIFYFLVTMAQSGNGSLIESLYCGTSNCYEILNVNRETVTKSEISKAYRLLARKYHPDLHHTADAKREATEKFQKIAQAYEILKDDNLRLNYNFMLDNPEKFYLNYLRYYKYKFTPKIDYRWVLGVTITVISIIQYLWRWQCYKQAIEYFAKIPKYRNKAMEILQVEEEQEKLEQKKKLKQQQKQLNQKYQNSKSSEHQKWQLKQHQNEQNQRDLDDEQRYQDQQQKQNDQIQNQTPQNSKKVHHQKKTKTEKKEELEKQILRIIENKMDIKGGYAKPTIKDILWIQLLLLPYAIISYIWWYLKWQWLHLILKEPLNINEKLYLIQKHLKLGKYQFDSIDDSKKMEFLKMELWIKENFIKWKEEQENEMKMKLAENPKFKQYRRYLKNHGTARMTFED